MARAAHKVWLWATVTRLFTVFTIAKNRSGDVAKALLGSEDGQVVGSDRFSAYEWIKASWRQVCWAHLRRDFQAMIDRGGDGERVGRRLLSLSNRLFRHWHRVRDGTLPWSAFQERMSRLRREVKQPFWTGRGARARGRRRRASRSSRWRRVCGRSRGSKELSRRTTRWNVRCGTR